MTILLLLLTAVAVVVLIFALLLLVAFSYLQIKLLEKIFLGDEIPNQVSNSIEDTNTLTLDKAPDGSIPLEQFTPRMDRPTRLVFVDDGENHGVQEEEEGDVR